MGGSKVEPSQPSQEERNLQAYQLQLLQKQQAESEAVQPVLLAQFGYKMSPKEGGGYTVEKMTEAERRAQMTPEQISDLEMQNIVRSAELENLKYQQAIAPEEYAMRKEQLAMEKERLTMEKSGFGLTQKLQERTLAALEGKLEVSPALESNLQSKRQDLMETLSRKLGPNWATTTPGIQSLSEFEKGAELVREEARRGQIESGVGMLSQLTPRSSVTSGVGEMPRYTPGATTQNQISGLASLYQPNLAERIPGLLQPYQYYSGQSQAANIAEAQRKAALQSTYIGAGAAVGGAAIGAIAI